MESSHSSLSNFSSSFASGEYVGEGGGCLFSRSRKSPASKFSAPMTNKRSGSNRKDEDDNLLVQELNALSVQERETVMDEIHGVAKPITETPELVEETLKEILLECQKLPKNKRKAFDRAIFLKPSLEQDRKFHLMFLRAEKFNVSDAARRMANYFESKLILFGEDKLVKKITLQDLSEEDMECVNTGSFQILQKKDRSGRTMWFIALGHAKFKSWKSYTRYCWYLIMTALEDEDAQIHGVVHTIYSLGMREMNYDLTVLARKSLPLALPLPFRLCSLHFCFDDPRLQALVNLFVFVLGKQARIRFRIHFGSSIEVQYALLSFGIPSGCIPIQGNPDDSPSIGELDLTMHSAFISKRLELEEKHRLQEAEEQQKAGFVWYPTNRDVILGRGKPYQEFPGNLKLSKLLLLYRDRYKQATERLEKLCITMDVVKTVQESGGKFLQRNSRNGWEAVSDDAAREKVSQAIRMKNSNKNHNALQNNAYLEDDARNTTPQPSMVPSKRLKYT